MIFHESCHKKNNLQHIPSETAEKLYYYVLWTGHFLCKPDFHIRRTNYKTYLLLYTVSGEGVLLYGGKRYTLRGGSLFFIDCRELQEYYPIGDGWEFKYVHFKGVLSDRYYEYLLNLYGSPVFEGGAAIEECLDQIIEIVGHFGEEETCSELIYRILTKSINAFHSRGVVDDDPIGSAVRYISEHYKEEITVSELADVAHISRCYFSIRFKTQTGFSPYQFLLLYRIGYAKRLLDDTGKSMSEIAERSGFPDASSFIRAFKRAEGVSPSAYRKAKLG